MERFELPDMINALLWVALALCQEAEELPQERLKGVDEWDLELLPDRTIYRAYLADPRQCRTGVKLEIPVQRNRDLKIENTLGSYRPLALWTNPNDPGEEAEFFLEGAVFSRFDITQSWDMDAADYKFGFPFDYRRDDVTLKVEIYHLTSHLGDQFLTKGRDNHRTRDSYHLEEMVFGGQWTPSDEFRVYAEGGFSVYHGPATGSGRFQVGAEWMGRPWYGWMTPYVATDFSTRHEEDWGVNGTIAAGVWVRGRSGSNGIRFSIEYYSGHDQETQFKNLHQQFIGLNVSGDF